MEMKVERRDNLRIKQMAQYKAMRDGDALLYELIENRITTKPSMRGIALSCSSVEEYEKFKKERAYEEDEVHVDCPMVPVSLSPEPGGRIRTLKTREAVSKQDKLLENSEELDSDKNYEVRSSRNYWEDIEPQLNKHARLLDMSGTLGEGRRCQARASDLGLQQQRTSLANKRMTLNA